MIDDQGVQMFEAKNLSILCCAKNNLTTIGMITEQKQLVYFTYLIVKTLPTEI